LGWILYYKSPFIPLLQRGKQREIIGKSPLSSFAKGGKVTILPNRSNYLTEYLFK